MNSPLQSDYQRLYNVGLIDDLHNYFPALLYEPEAFQSVPQVLVYVRRQIQRTFNPFAYGMRQYEAQRPVPRTLNIPVNLNPNAVSIFETLLEASLLLNPNRTLNTNSAFMAPVRVFPSTVQIAAATLVESVVVEGEVCAICQDGFAIGDEKRVIRACNHGFHRSCIDTWFQENVHCPVCRHDIRELTSSVLPGPQVAPPPL